MWKCILLIFFLTLTLVGTVSYSQTELSFAEFSYKDIPFAIQYSDRFNGVTGYDTIAIQGSGSFYLSDTNTQVVIIDDTIMISKRYDIDYGQGATYSETASLSFYLDRKNSLVKNIETNNNINTTGSFGNSYTNNSKTLYLDDQHYILDSDNTINFTLLGNALNYVINGFYWNRNANNHTWSDEGGNTIVFDSIKATSFLKIKLKFKYINEAKKYAEPCYIAWRFDALNRVLIRSGDIGSGVFHTPKVCCDLLGRKYELPIEMDNGSIITYSTRQLKSGIYFIVEERTNYKFLLP